MKIAPFVGRQRELALLDRLWDSPSAEFLVLYGRRRVGKTRLLTHWLEISGARVLYWVAEPTSTYDQLRAFSQTLYNFANPQDPAPEKFAYADWRQAFQQASRLAQDQRLALFIDEFTYLLAAEAGLAGILQNQWDHQLQHSNLLLILSGSHIGMLERHLLAYQAPLYGRATARLQLNPLPYAATRPFFPGYSLDERVTVYAVLGGIPAYWERFAPDRPLEDNLREQFLTANNLLQDEPRLLLQDFVNDPHNYVAILRAIAHNARTPKEIGLYSGLNDRHVPAYLSRLVETGFVERRVPVTELASSRLGRHYITDPFLRFYYRFLAHRQTQLALGVQDQSLEEIQRHLPDFIGKYTWEELCREWLLRAGGAGVLPMLPDQVGSAWTRQAEVDVVGINSMQRTLLLGECKWQTRAQGVKVLQDLIEKTSEMVPPQGQWQVSYLGFARRGWTAPAVQFAAEFEGAQGQNWQAQGLRLLTLEEVDADLAAWTG
jgi:AAA+ ATPase superfamily predicted ATPase